MAGIADLRDLSLPEALSRMVETLEEIGIGEKVEFILDKNANIGAIVEHISDYAECDAEQKEKFILLGVVKKADFEMGEEEITIDENTNVGRLIEKYPDAIEILASYGFTPLKNPVLRKTLARTITLERARKLKGLSDAEFQEMLEKLRALQK